MARYELGEVGDQAPRSRRGHTLLPPGMVKPQYVWTGRFFLVLLMTIGAPLSGPIAAWWMWGNRRRMWRWKAGVAGLISAFGALVLYAATGGHGLLASGPAVFGSLLADRLPPAVAEHLSSNVNVSALVISGWIIGTIVGNCASVIAWQHTPPYRDRPRPKTMLTKWKEGKFVDAVANGGGDRDGYITFGVDNDTGDPVEIPWSDLAGHALTVGAPGSGKSTSSMRVVRASIRDGHFTAIVDMKGDPELVQEVAGYARQWNRPMWVFSDTGPSRYDPFRHGDYNRKRDLLMATSEWTEAHYKARAGDYLLAVFYLLDVTGVPAGTSWLHRVAELLDVAKLQQAAAALPASDPRSAEAVARVTTVVNEVILDPRSVGGLAPRVRALTATRLGAWVKPGEPEIDLEKIWDVGGVVVFSLPSLSYPEAATAFGGLAVQDLKTLAGTLGARGNKQPGLVFVDEFATLGSNNVSAALAMSRSSGLAWMLATQDLGDLKVGPDGAAFEQKVLTNTNLKVLHAVGDPETAERLAKLAGSKWTVKERASVNLADSALDTTTGIASGQGFVDALLGPVVEPTNIMNQSTGEKSTFILINKMGAWARTNVHTVRDMALKPGDSTAIQWLPGAVASVEEQEAAARVAEDIEVQDMLQMDAAEIEASVAMKPVRDFGESAIPQQVTPTRVAEDFDHWGDPAPSSQAPVEAPVRPAGWHAGVDTTPAPQPDMRTASESAFWTTTPAPEPPAGGYTAHPVQPASAPAVQPVLPPLAQPVIPQMPPVVPGQPFVPQAPLPVTYDPPQPRKAPDGPRKAPVSETSMNDTDGWWD